MDRDPAPLHRLASQSCRNGAHSQKHKPPRMISVQQRKTNTGPALPVSQSAACSTRLKQRITSPEHVLKIAMGMSTEHKADCHERGARGRREGM